MKKFVISAVLADGSNQKFYIALTKSNTGYIVSNINDAKHFDLQLRARSYMLNSISKALKKTCKDWKVEEHIIENNTKEDSNIENNITVINSSVDTVVAESSLEIYTEDIYVENKEENNEYPYTFTDFDDLENSLNDLARRINYLYDNKDSLAQEHSKVEKQIDELLHFLEFETYSASLGYKVSRLLTLLRQYRRKIKDEMMIISYFNSHTCNNIAKGNTFNSIEGLRHRKYSYEFFAELFENKYIDEYIAAYESVLKLNKKQY